VRSGNRNPRSAAAAGKPARVLSVLQVATAVGIIAFWAAFFTIGLAPEHAPPGYAQFEHAFPLPDGLLAVALLIAAAGLRGGSDAARRQGRRLSLVCAGGLLFLGVLDLSFNVQNGIYTSSLADGLLAAAIQAWCIGFGAWLVVRCWE
jgi:hypothetical protein